MLDIHCHILPNVDDGPQTLNESLEMARFYVSDGIRYVVATPHCHRYVHLLRADILPRVDELNRRLQADGIPLTVLPGSEIQLTDSLAYREDFEAGLYCHLGDSNHFTLLEFNWSPELFPPDASGLVEWIRSQGTIPILAHPERHDFFAREPKMLSALVDAGAWLQITVDSLLGNHGPLPKAFSAALMQEYENVVLATDAHNMKRCSGLSIGYDWVEFNLGQPRKEQLLARSESMLTQLLKW
jgi:protein-tyrosine phosphatase